MVTMYIVRGKFKNFVLKIKVDTYPKKSVCYFSRSIYFVFIYLSFNGCIHGHMATLRKYTVFIALDNIII